MIDLIFCLLGVLLGIAFGLVPGMHINNFLPLLTLFSLSNNQLFFFVIALSMSYVFASSFPAIMLGVPNEETALNVLPGHRMVLNGNAFSAIILSLIGGLFSVIFSALFLIFFLTMLPVIYPVIEKEIPYLLSIVVLLMILSDKKSALLVLLLSSILGLLTFKLNLLLPLLSGFFGLSTIIFSLLSNSKLPVQALKFNSIMKLSRISFLSFTACFLSSIFGFVPAISSSIVGTIATYLRRFNAEEFLVLQSGTNAAYMSYSFFALFLIQKTRSGSAVFLSQIFESESVFFVLGLTLLSSAVSFLLCSRIAKIIIQLYGRIDYIKLSFMSISLILSVNLFLTGFVGILVLFCSTAIGLLCNLLQVKRINCMAALIVPTIIVLL